MVAKNITESESVLSMANTVLRLTAARLKL